MGERTEAQRCGRGEGRVPVYAVWPDEVGPLLSLGMLTAAARVWEGGALNDHYEIRRPETATSFLDDLATRSGPAVLLCSNYVWSLDHNLAAAADGRAIAPGLIVVHGGPSTPKYESDAAAFLALHRSRADVLVRGEGETTLCELLAALVSPDGITIDDDRLGGVQGLTFRHPVSGSTVRTDDRDRLTDLDVLPSPYLTGEFDDIPPDAWRRTMSIETNRGCPYGCTFCDWGSATMSRIRKFSMERVRAEIEWAAQRNIKVVTITDANFGIMSRDVEIAEAFADVYRRTGAPHGVSWTGAKNTTKHLVKIMGTLIEAGVAVSTSLSLQTTDPATLAVLDRSNISTDHFVELAADYRRHGYPIQGELMLGLPSQTFETYKADLQFMLDHEITVRSWPVQMLPNAPMNAPEYRREHGIEVNGDGLITSTSSFDESGRLRMMRFRTVDTVAERMGVLRHVMRYLQWDHGIVATDFMERVLDVVDARPHRFPSMSWLFSYYDLFQVPPAGWSRLYAEVADLLVEEFGFDRDDSGLATVLAVQQALMPAPGRQFPASVDLPHDYVTYYRSAVRTLYTTGKAGTPPARLASYPSGSLAVTGDPLELCTVGMQLGGDPRDDVMLGDFHLGCDVANELESPLMRILPAFSDRGVTPASDWTEWVRQVVAGHEADDDGQPEDAEPADPVVVTIGRRR